MSGVGEDGFLRYHLALATILAVEVGIVRTVVAQLGKESPMSRTSLSSCEGTVNIIVIV